MSKSTAGSKPFKAITASARRARKYLGTFATAEEAALAVARFLGPEGVAAALARGRRRRREPAPMTAAEAHAAAAEEGLALLRAENPTGFKGVSRNHLRQQAVPGAADGTAGATATSAPSRRRRRRRSPSRASSGRRASRAALMATERGWRRAKTLRARADRA